MIMQPLRAVRRRIWRRLEPRVQQVVDQRLDHAFGLVPAPEPAEARHRAVDQLRELAEIEHVLMRRSQERDERIDELGRQLRATAATAAEARRLATEASRAIERLLQAELEIWQALDAMGSSGRCASPGALTASPGRSA